MSGRSARTIRIFSVEVSPDLVLLDVRKVDFHDFGNYWKVTSSQNGLKTFLFVPVFGNTIFLKARVSVSQIKPMNSLKNDQTKTYFIETIPESRKTFMFCENGYLFLSSIRIFQTQTHTQLKKLPHPTPYGVFGNLLGVPSYLFGHGLAPPPPTSHGQTSNWKRPLNFRQRHLGWGGIAVLLGYRFWFEIC